MSKNVYKKPALIAISAIAMSVSAAHRATAQVQITCPQPTLSFGEIVVCSGGDATMAPNGSLSFSLGGGSCSFENQPGDAAHCILSTGGDPAQAPTQNVNVNMTAAFININNGGNLSRVDDYLLQDAGGGSAKATLTFTPTEVTGGVTIDIGATMQINTSMPLGRYVGTIRITAN